MAVSAGELDDDRALVCAVQQGDRDAYSELFRRHYPSVRRACARRLLNDVEADEVAQAAFVKAFERIQQCDGDRRFGPWVHVIARYLCVDHTRAKARVVPLETPMSDDVTTGAQPEDTMLEAERSEHVHRALASLPDRQRNAVIARTFENRRPVEIAAALGMSVGAVDSLLLRARRGLAVAYQRVAGEAGTAATATSTSAAASLGSTIAVGPKNVVEGMVSAGQAAGGAAVEVATKAVAVPKGIGASIASAVASVTMAVTGADPGPAPAAVTEREAVVVTTTAPTSQLPPLPDQQAASSTSGPSSAAVAAPPADNRSPASGNAGPALGDAVGTLPLPVLGGGGAPSAERKGSSSSPPEAVSGVTGGVEGTVDRTLDGGVGSTVGGLVGGDTQSSGDGGGGGGKGKDEKDGKKAPPPAPGPVGGLTSGVGGLLRG